MQTKLRIVLLAFVAGLICTSAMATAPTTQVKAPVKSGKAVHQNHKPTPQHKVRYIGVASWYGRQHQGRKMANGKPFDRNKMTAASWNLPLGSVVRVVNLKNGNSVNVTITDRGPNHRLQRLIDLSEAAAVELDYVQNGVTPVVLIPLPSPKLESTPITAELVELPADFPSPIHESAPAKAMQAVSLLGTIVP